MPRIVNKSDVLFSQLVLLLLVVAEVQSRLLDMSRDKEFVVRIHNNERSNTQPMAANMRDLTWDSRLQGQAEEWANNCEYSRPPTTWNVGSNLYYHRQYVHGHASIRRMVKDSLDAWIRQKAYSAYSSNCGPACLYIQMIHADVDRVGCAISTCNKLVTRRHGYERATLFVCLYSPRVDLRNSFPYIEGTPCSKCPHGQSCVDGTRCAKGVASRLPDPYPNDKYVAPYTWPRTSSRQVVPDAMTAKEKSEILELHNDFRQKSGLSPLNWDNYLERWTRHIINCSVDYPGPRYTYSNFHRFNADQPLTGALYTWQSRANEKPPRVQHKCRSPDDREPCSHWSNIMQSQATAMSCSTRACEGYTRQMVCIYDNKYNRDNRLAELRRTTRPARRWRYGERYEDGRRTRRRGNNNNYRRSNFG